MNITFIVLTYNHEDHILKCLNSIKYQKKHFGQEQVNIELIVSDDASRDKTAAVVKEWIQKNSRYFSHTKLIANSENKGTCLNYLGALKNATGDYIKAVGGDDIFPPYSILPFFEELANYDLVIGNPVTVEQTAEPDDIVNLYRKEAAIYSDIEKCNFRKKIHEHCALCGPATYISKEMLTHPKVIDMLTQYRYIDDYTQWLAMSEVKNIKLKYLDRPAIIYMRTGNSTCMVKAGPLLEERLRIQRYARDTAPGYWEKLVCKSYLYAIQYPGSKLAYWGNLVSWISKWHQIKHQNDKRPNDHVMIAESLEYIKNLERCE